MTRAVAALTLAAWMTAGSGVAQTATTAQRGGDALVLVGLGRFAVYADVASIRREGATATVRAFQVVEADFTAGGAGYWGGWSRWRFDCGARTADRLDFASVREGGSEGPAVADNAPPFPAAPGGDAAELLDMACGTPPEFMEPMTLVEAVRRGRALLAE